MTLGPRGRHVVLAKKFGGPTITNDGVTIAREIELDDPFENLGAQLAKTAATKTNDVAGDGTTTATVLAQALVTEGLRNVAAGANPIGARRRHRHRRRRGHRGAAASRHPGRRRRTASPRSAPSPRATRTSVSCIGEAMTKVGQDGVITVEESSTLATELEVTEGVAVRQGLHLALLRHRPDAQEAVLEDALVLLNREKISSLADLLPLLEKVARVGQAAADHRRGRRGRGAVDAGRQRHPQDASRSSRSRRRSSATAARRSSTTSPSSPAAR